MNIMSNFWVLFFIIYFSTGLLSVYSFNLGVRLKIYQVKKQHAIVFYTTDILVHLFVFFFWFVCLSFFLNKDLCYFTWKILFYNKQNVERYFNELEKA